ncbi:MAG: isocitrate/isopropylmalate dehydrogenase family protein [Nitrososphaeria archaeon]|nr:isocitrate/isopropylmalate dehydrogenase family protein [Conexivisphaerales archaeon]
MKYRIAWMKGDGIGPEISQAAIKVIEALGDLYDIGWEIRFYEMGDETKKRFGTALPEETLDGIRASDLAIKGPVGETAFESIVYLRQTLDLYANIRPARSYKGVPSVKPMDILIVRENTEDLYKGIEFKINDTAVALKLITEKGTRRIAKVAANYALNRKKKVTIVHKANVMRVTDGFFRDIAKQELERYGLEVDEKYVDAMSMAIIRNPQDFDVLLTPNVYGDILSDEAAQAAGGLGFAASANIGDESNLFEPVHGSAPDIAGKGIANPYSMFNVLVMALDYLWINKKDANARYAKEGLEKAVETCIEKGYLTPDAGGKLKTEEVTKYLEQELKAYVK